MKVFLALFLTTAIAAAFGLQLGWYAIPDRWNPLAPLRIDDEPNLLTRFKVQRLGTDSRQCREVLATTGFQFTPLADRNTGPGCGFDNAVTVSRTSVRLSSPAPMSCRNAVSLAMWEKHVVEPAALLHFNQPLARIDHLGSYSCRNVYGKMEGRRSQHATADALDVAAFVMANGKRITVMGDWSRADAASLFLHDVHDGACRYFDGVLGPDYNAAHRDHFHLDRGSYPICR